MKNRMKKLVAIAATAAMVGSLPVSAVTTYAADDDFTIGAPSAPSTAHRRAVSGAGDASPAAGQLRARCWRCCGNTASPGG